MQETKGAIFSPCRGYRYMLFRAWDLDKPKVMFIGLNPSTANETQDDPTIRRVVSISKNLGYGGVYMMNCFPLVSTDPKRLRDFYSTSLMEMEFELNDSMLKRYGKNCYDVIFAWGKFEIVSQQGRDFEIFQMFKNPKALILNNDGSPRHPLYVPGNVKPVEYVLPVQKVKKRFK